MYLYKVPFGLAILVPLDALFFVTSFYLSIYYLYPRLFVH